MDELIKKLAEQAGFENGHQDRYGNSLSQELEKFAELIVKECIAMSTGQNQYKLGFQLAKDFSNHFGVK